jgi:ApaG protein
METLITKGIQISVEANYQLIHSDPLQEKNLFTYEISIHNLSNHPVKLLRRHWFIFDSFGGIKEVEGEGVVGKQPEIMPGKYYEYSSWCPLQSEIGYMEGLFLMMNLNTEELFEVKIPRFHLVAEHRLN